MCGGDCGGGYSQVGKVQRPGGLNLPWKWGAYDEGSCTEDFGGERNTERSDVSLCCLDKIV